jgi:hypothetical protein
MRGRMGSSEAKPISRLAHCTAADGFRKSSTHPAMHALRKQKRLKLIQHPADRSLRSAQCTKHVCRTAVRSMSSKPDIDDYRNMYVSSAGQRRGKRVASNCTLHHGLVTGDGHAPTFRGAFMRVIDPSHEAKPAGADEAKPAGVEQKTCTLCGRPMQLARTEPHPTFRNLEIRVFVCDECDRISSDVIRCR